MENNRCPMKNEEVKIESRCYACRLPIWDHFLLSVHPGVKFHERCLRCGECGRLLSEKDVCYCMKAQIYCAHDFHRLFGGKCRNLSGNLPKEQHQQQQEEEQQSSLAPSTSPTDPATKPPRHRTPMTEVQLQALKTSYTSNPRPDARERERLASAIGLKARVIRVWFQNRRCKEKKENLKN